MITTPLAGKVALITGSARNMGRAFDVALAHQGADVVVHYHAASAQPDAAETARLARAHGVRALVVGGDLAEARHCATALRPDDQRLWSC